MEKVLYEAAGVTKAVLRVEQRQVYVVWHQFPAKDDFKPCLEAQAREVGAGRVDAVIVDCRKTVGVPLQEDQKFLVEKIFPTFIKGRLKAIITLVPESALTKFGARKWQETGSQSGITMFEAGSEDEVPALVASALKKAA